MKIGNLSQTLLKVPQFFLYPQKRNMETFKINTNKKPYRETDLLKSMKEMNYNNNYRNVQRRFFIDFDINSNKRMLLNLKPEIETCDIRDYPGRNNYRAIPLPGSTAFKLSCKTFNKTDQGYS